MKTNKNILIKFLWNIQIRSHLHGINNSTFISLWTHIVTDLSFKVFTNKFQPSVQQMCLILLKLGDNKEQMKTTLCLEVQSCLFGINVHRVHFYACIMNQLNLFHGDTVTTRQSLFQYNNDLNNNVVITLVSASTVTSTPFRRIYTKTIIF